MEILKTGDGRSIVLESYAIERPSRSDPVTVHARLLVTTPSQTPKEMRIQVEYSYDDLPRMSEREFGQRLLTLLEQRVQSVP